VKRIIAITLTVLLVSAVIFSGCAGPAEPTTPTTPTEPEVKPIEWRYESFVPPSDCFSIDAVEWAEGLEEATDGRLKMTFFFAQSLVKLQGEFDAVVSGTCDMGTPVPYYTPERLPLSSAAIVTLFAYTHQVQEGKTYCALVDKYKELRDEFLPTRVAWWQAPPPDSLIISNKQVKTMEDLKGLKMRISSAQLVKAYKLMGAAPVVIPVPDVYHALETGVVDAASSEPNEFYLWKNYETTKYRTVVGGTAGRGFPTLVNINSYNKLPEDIRQLFDEHTDMWERTIFINEGHEEFIKESLGKILEYDSKAGNPPWYVLPDAERERWKQAAQPVNEETIAGLEEKGLPAREFVEDAIAFGEQFLNPEFLQLKYE
jgi:TRAP-type C4-dicarboxylate transport system substrate-binding protein